MLRKLKNFFQSTLIKKLAVVSVVILMLGVLVMPHVSFADGSSGCGFTTQEAAIACVYSFFGALLDTVAIFLTAGAALVLWFSGILLDQSMIHLVVNMKDAVTSLSAIYTVWQTMRDLANMFLIFIILWIAILTITGDDGYKKMLTKVVIVALFINFSLFFTNILVDASNITSTMFYQAIVGPDTNSCIDGCLTYRVLTTLKLDSIADRQPGDLAITGKNFMLGFFARFAGIIVMLAAAVVFIASAAILIKRFITLISLMMFSSICFAAQVLPKTEEWYKWWWKKLTDECFSTPVYFLFLWVVFKVMDSGMLLQTTNDNLVSSILKATSPTASTNIVYSSVSLVINYAIVLGLLAMAPVVAAKAGASGADWAASITKFADINGRIQRTATSAYQYPLRVAGQLGVRAGSKAINTTLDSFGQIGKITGTNTAWLAGQAINRTLKGTRTGSLVATKLGISRKDINAFNEKITDRAEKIGGALGTTGYLGKRIADATSKELEKTKIFGKTDKEHKTADSEYEKARFKEIDDKKKKAEFDKAFDAWKVNKTDAALSDELERNIRKLGNAITAMNVESIKDSIKFLNKAQLEAIESADEEKTDLKKDVKKDIAKARKNYNKEEIKKGTEALITANALPIGDPNRDTKIKSAKKLISDAVKLRGDEIAKLDFADINNAEIMSAATKEQMQALKKRTDLTAAQIKELFTKRVESVSKALTAAAAAAVPNIADLKKALSKIQPSDYVHLKLIEFTQKDETLDLLTKPALDAILKDPENIVEESVREQIRAALEKRLRMTLSTSVTPPSAISAAPQNAAGTALRDKRQETLKKWLEGDGSIF